MSIENRAKATAKDAEGKLQEAIGKVTDNHEAQLKGKAKQGEAEMRHAVEDTKDKAKDLID
jgi:uncharacterized protein YjbJ (UPF0337 family)